MPWIGVPEDEDRNIINKDLLERKISQSFGKDVVIDNNTRAYTFYEKWSNQSLPEEDFIFISIRSGIGTGIFLNGSLLRGSQNIAGELGHLVIRPGEELCRCGNKGCLETIINQEVLYNQYLKTVRKNQINTAETLKIEDALNDLFTLASNDNREAKQIITDTAEYLSRALIPLVATLNIRNGIISGHFGENGIILAECTLEKMKTRLLPGMDFKLQYSQFNPSGHTHGAALLVMNQFLGLH
jgi:predicted NBD/HSP70 family sugar kinase